MTRGVSTAGTNCWRVSPELAAEHLRLKQHFPAAQAGELLARDPHGAITSSLNALLKGCGIPSPYVLGSGSLAEAYQTACGDVISGLENAILSHKARRQLMLVDGTGDEQIDATDLEIELEERAIARIRERIALVCRSA